MALAMDCPTPGSDWTSSRVVGKTFLRSTIAWARARSEFDLRCHNPIGLR
jgi:hypothetical protein